MNDFQKDVKNTLSELEDDYTIIIDWPRVSILLEQREYSIRMSVLMEPPHPMYQDDYNVGISTQTNLLNRNQQKSFELEYAAIRILFVTLVEVAYRHYMNDYLENIDYIQWENNE